jgi:hypothetical protein
VIVPQPKVGAIVVFLAGHCGDIPIVARDFGETLPAQFVQFGIFRDYFYVHLPDLWFKNGWIHLSEKNGIQCKTSDRISEPVCTQNRHTRYTDSINAERRTVKAREMAGTIRN